MPQHTRTAPPAHIVALAALVAPDVAPVIERQYVEPMATERQLAYITTLRSQRTMAPEHSVWLDAKLAEGIRKSYASEIIGRLLALPVIDGTPPAGSSQSSRADETFSNLPAGRYALRHPNDTLNPIRFYSVSVGKTGTRWEGYRFVERFASDDKYPIRPGADRTRVLSEIAAAPLAAAQLYGHEAKQCSRCGRSLTRRLSRELGIGPRCAEKSGWMTPDMVANAKATIIAAGFNPDDNMED